MLLMYPCSAMGSSVVTVSIMALFTAVGEGMLGFPRLKSYTFSRPCSFASLFPSSNMARITLLLFVRLIIFSEIIVLAPFWLFFLRCLFVFFGKLLYMLFV